MAMRKLFSILTVCALLGILMCWGPFRPSPGRAQGTPPLRPVERLPREKFGVVDAFPLDEQDLGAPIFPSATAEERQAVLEGLAFFTTPHTAAEGLGPDANQAFCLGCHANSAEVPRGAGLISTSSPISRAARSTPTNFELTALDPVTGGGRAPDHDVTVDPRTGAITGTGKTAAFTLFGDFKLATGSANPLFDPLDTTGPHFTQPHFPRLFPPPFQGSRFGGAVQHGRPSLSACWPDRIPPIEIDPNLPGVTVDPRTGLLTHREELR